MGEGASERIGWREGFKESGDSNVGLLDLISNYYHASERIGWREGFKESGDSNVGLLDLISNYYHA